MVLKNGEITQGTDGVPLLRITTAEDPLLPDLQEPVVTTGDGLFDLTAEALRDVVVWQPERRDGEPTGDWRIQPAFWSRPQFKHYKREGVWKQQKTPSVLKTTETLISELEKAKGRPLWRVLRGAVDPACGADRRAVSRHRLRLHGRDPGGQHRAARRHRRAGADHRRGRDRVVRGGLAPSARRRVGGLRGPDGR